MDRGKNLSCFFGVIFTILALLLIWFASVLQSDAQNIIRKDNVFYEDSSKSKKKKGPTLTPYTYVDKNGVSYPVYVTSNGKYFIIKVAKTTGKKYRKPLPELQKQLK